MKKTNIKELVGRVHSEDLKGLQAALESDSKSARSPQLVVDAARAAWTSGLKLLRKHGADMNAEWRNYRPLTAVIQEHPHTTATANLRGRLVCLKWLLSHGADPERLGGWPAARAIITAAFVGEIEFVEELKRNGARVDGFVAASLGDLIRVRKALPSDPSFAMARDSAGLTALQCVAGSRMGKAGTKTGNSLFMIAELLVEAGADVRATVRSWGHDVDVVYFAASSGQGRLFERFLNGERMRMGHWCR